MLATCIILNGPPNCGKDTLADLITHYGYVKHQMKDALYRETAEFFNVYPAELVLKSSDRAQKELPWEALTLEGVPISPREALIHVSEQVIKPNRGKNFFGKAAATACENRNSQLAVFPDSGFDAEVAELARVFERVFIFRLFREGCEWGNDSRYYLEGFVDTHTITLVTGKPWLAVQEILQFVRKETKDANIN